jgi:hypothetical protein
VTLTEGVVVIISGTAVRVGYTVNVTEADVQMLGEPLHNWYVAVVTPVKLGEGLNVY